MIGLTRELFQKELRLQRNPMLLTLAVVVLGAAVLLMLAVTRQDFAGFSTDELRAALFTTGLLPMLVFILPLMIGSTAAAAEKAMGVLAWQAALPASGRRIFGTKLTVVALLCAVVGGTLPYLLQLAIPAREYSIFWIFRDAWPGWTALLCGAIGFYSGSLARDDYQGLLISAVPVTALILVMYMADPSRLVFPGPFGYSQAIWKDWALAFRLLIIAGVFAWLGARLLVQGKQPSRRQLLFHAVALVAITFGLTLWNVVTERSLIQHAVSYNHGSRPMMWQMDEEKTSTSRAMQLATLRSEHNRDFSARLELFPDKKRYDSQLVFGEATRISWRTWSSAEDTSRHLFAVNYNGEIHEFTQSPDLELTGWSADGRWILGLDSDRSRKIICGPFGLAISSAIMPESWFYRLQSSFNFSMVKPTQSTFVMSGQAIPANPKTEPVLKSGNGRLEIIKNDKVNRSYLIGPDDVEVSIGDRGIIWKDGGKELAPAERKKLLLNWTQRMDNVFTVSLINDSGATSTAILKPTDNYGVYITAGWVRGEVDQVSSDYGWAMSYRSAISDDGSPRVYRQLESRARAEAAETTGAQLLKKWEILNSSRSDDGTTVILIGWLWEVPVNTPSGDPHIWFSYRKFSPISAAEKILHENFPYESGVMVFNLETGTKTDIPIPMPWPAAATMSLQSPIPRNHMSFYGSDWPGTVWDNSPKLVVVQNGYVAIVRFKGGKLEPESMITNYSYIPTIYNDSTATFISEDKLLTTDGTSIWLVNASR